VTAAVVAGLTAASLSADEVEYDRDIQPLIQTHCYACHGPDTQESGLRLDIRRRALAGGDGGVSIVPGSGADSGFIQRVFSSDEDYRMPPEGDGLSAAEVSLLRRWIDLGALGIPEHAAPSAADRHWAFQPILRPALPTIADTAWSRNDIDRFVLAGLNDHDIEPSPEAAPEILIRRLYLDLVGLPPTWERVVEFTADSRTDAYERLVDELLDSPHYGERWARHWLDLARYADSSGYEADTPREIWAYRDWVIGAFNADMPFDQFVTEQLAGDLLPNATVSQRSATGFHCNAMFDPGVRHESIIDQVNTTGAAFLGLTTGCAQCHSHKTDPLTHREFYQLYAFFNEAAITEMKLNGEFYVPPAASDPADGEAVKVPKPATTLVLNRTPQPTHIFVRGEPKNPGDQVQPGFPEFLNSRRATSAPEGSVLDSAQSEPLTRLDLARWLTSVDNPLTARVTVNRVWQRLLGTGLVRTENDFGMQTTVPVHLELLDYLASELRGSDSEAAQWRGFKSLHRLIVTSATYRQSSNVRPELDEADPEHQLFARQRRFRLEAESIRDVALVTSGLLCQKIGGPSVFPYQADGILENRATPATWTISEGEDRYRRGLYTWVWRLTPHPGLPLFDAPDGVTACTRRTLSNVPVQALTLLNGPTFVEAARAMAARVVSVAAISDTERVVNLMRICLSREPSSAELTLLHALITEQRQVLETNQSQALQICQDAVPPNCDAVEFATWVIACRVVMNLDEFITRE
jgi:hypothetical protein